MRTTCSPVFQRHIELSRFEDAEHEHRGRGGRHKENQNRAEHIRTGQSTLVEGVAFGQLAPKSRSAGTGLRRRFDLVNVQSWTHW